MAFNPNEHLMDLKGKSYLQVMWRLVWFREEKPLWNIETKLERLEDNHAVFSAKIYDETGVQKSSGYGSEGLKDFKDFIEKAETKAVGRALAMLGYGTQFAPEMDEGDRIVDSPVPGENAPQSGDGLPRYDMSEQEAPPPPEPPLGNGGFVCSRCGKGIDDRVYDYSSNKYGRPLCRACQKLFNGQR